MPFKSQAQRRMMFATNPEVAKEMQAKTRKGAKLPEHVAKKKAQKKAPAKKVAKKKMPPGIEPKREGPKHEAAESPRMKALERVYSSRS